MCRLLRSPVQDGAVLLLELPQLRVNVEGSAKIALPLLVSILKYRDRMLVNRILFGNLLNVLNAVSMRQEHCWDKHSFRDQANKMPYKHE